MKACEREHQDRHKHPNTDNGHLATFRVGYHLPSQHSIVQSISILSRNSLTREKKIIDLPLKFDRRYGHSPFWNRKLRWVVCVNKSATLGTQQTEMTHVGVWCWQHHGEHDVYTDTQLQCLTPFILPSWSGCWLVNTDWLWRHTHTYYWKIIS